METLGTDDCQETMEDLSEYEGDLKSIKHSVNSELQIDSDIKIPADVEAADQTSFCEVLVNCSRDFEPHQVSESKNLAVSESHDKHAVINVTKSDLNTICTSDNQYCEGKASTQTFDNYAVLAALSSPSQYTWEKVEKSDSPRIRCQLKSAVFSALIDSGAEVNALDRDFVLSLNIGINTTKETACAANKLPLEICGQTSEPIAIKCYTDSGHTMLQLGIVLVIANLGACCLLGEPAKQRNNIVCLPKHKIVIIANGGAVHYAPYDTGTTKHTLIRALHNQTLAPGEQICYDLPEHLTMESSVCITPRISALSWLKPAIFTPANGSIYLVNSSTEHVDIKKSDHLADVRNTSIAEPQQKCVLNKAVHDDQFQFADLATSREIKPQYLEMIQLDPDNILKAEQRDVFNKLHSRFSQLFTPQPGKYNGSYGYISNQLQFAAPPPPNTKTRIPNYSPPMNSILAEINRPTAT